MGQVASNYSLALGICGYIICGFIGVLAATIIVWIWMGKIDLGSLLSEANGQASMSRFQLLIFTFVIAVSLFELVEKRADGSFPNIPDGVLTLLGISASTYAVGKGISHSDPSTRTHKPAGSNNDGAHHPATITPHAAQPPTTGASQ